jgi:hypothetical protein
VEGWKGDTAASTVLLHEEERATTIDVDVPITSESKHRTAFSAPQSPTHKQARPTSRSSSRPTSPARTIRLAQPRRPQSSMTRAAVDVAELQHWKTSAAAQADVIEQQLQLLTEAAHTRDVLQVIIAKIQWFVFHGFQCCVSVSTH